MTWLQAFARRLVADPDVAADLTQDTLVAAIESSPRGLRGSRLRAWLARVARNFASRRMRDEDVRRDHELRRAREPRATDDPDGLELQHALAGFLLKLPESYRDAVLLRYQHELPYARVAEELGISEVAARQRVSRGLERLRERMEERQGARSGTVSAGSGERGANEASSRLAVVAAWMAVVVLSAFAAWRALAPGARSSVETTWPERLPAARALTDADDLALAQLAPWLGVWLPEPPYEDEGAYEFTRSLDGKSVRATRSVMEGGAWVLASEGLLGWHHGEQALVFHEFTRDAGSFEVMKEGTVYFTADGAMVREYASYDPDGSSRGYREVFERDGANAAWIVISFEDDAGRWVPYGELRLRRTR